MRRSQTTHLKERFLENFAVMGNISKACEASNISRRVVYHWLEKDKTFAADYEEAGVVATEAPEAEAWRRAVEGDTVETPIIRDGRIVHTVVETKRSDTLLIFLLKARNPEKYRDVMSIRKDYRANVNIKHELSVSSDPDSLAAVLGILIESGALPAGSGPAIDAPAYEVYPARADAEAAGVPAAELP